MNALAMQAKGQLTQDTIVTTVMANLGLFKALQSKGIQSEVTQVGDKYVYDKMQNAELMLGGEQSGHIIFRHHMTTGDGLLSALKCLEIMVESKQSLVDLGKDCIIYPQYLKNIRVNDKLETLNNPKISQLILVIESALGSEGRILVRPSGTEPLIRVMVEALDFNTCTMYVNQVIQLIQDEGLSL
jgi:phosphoglucosamine mutase